MGRVNWIGGGTGGLRTVRFWPFGLDCVKWQVLTKSDYFLCVALDQIAMDEPFSLLDTPPEGFAPSPKERLGH